MTTADGTLEKRDDGRAVIRFERTIAHPPERVWAAITEPGEMIGWWGEADVDLRDGGRFDVRWLNTDEEGNSAHMHGTITRLDPPRLIEVGGDVHGTLRFELEPAGDGATLLRFTSTLELPEEFRTKVLAGWHTHLDALATVLDGGSVDLENIQREGWEDAHDAYVERDGAAAG
ncbi:MAG TPA: SRPBCC family protein [Thermoleophilaceae bacterium]|jgi:uncharacterized protein YndB with AHSA1/START domain